MTKLLAKDLYDVAVIGGGIHGVGVAQAAAALSKRNWLTERPVAPAN